MLKVNEKATPKSEVPAKASHDTQPPQALIDFMMGGWKQPSRKAAPKVQGLARFAARRKALSKLFPGECLVIPTGHEKVRANDTHYKFRPGSDFYYLTGNLEADCVLVLAPRANGGGHEEILFAEPEVDRSTPAFFTDRARGALWVGARLGLEGTKNRYGVDRALGLPELPEYLKGVGKGSKPFRVVRGLSPAVDGTLPGEQEKDSALCLALAKMRLIKEASEVVELQKAVDATQRAHEAVLRELKTAKTERELEVAFDSHARREGTGVSFATIIANGPHATVLHWTRNDGALVKGDLVLVDAGVESDSLYAGDITRTVPVSGRFSKDQKAIYDLITDAQDAAIAAVKPGADFMAPHRAAMKVIAFGLERLGILKVPAEQALRDDQQTFKRYTLHNTSHMLGIDVHDASAAPYREGKLEPGMALTIEPGLYFQLDDLTVPARYRGIGIRVEEDVVVTKKGCLVLSSKIPRKAKDIEAWIGRMWKSRK
ncbi:MAG: aminopeptidase P family protein [Deltaproteobacteria bacterium]|nr:aminopeptidase P family protein [Deltaproteobacteria bacterium]